MTSSRLWTPVSRRRSKARHSASGVMARPLPPRLISRFWQNTQPRAQPQKNTAPLPRLPLMQGSSPKWGAARATRISPAVPQRPVSPAARSAPQRRGHRVQCKVFPSQKRRAAFSGCGKAAALLCFFLVRLILRRGACTRPPTLPRGSRRKARPGSARWRCWRCPRRGTPSQNAGGSHPDRRGCRR